MQPTEDPTGPVVPVCRHCGSANVMRDAWAVWNTDTQSWELGASFDHSLCGNCDAETKWFEWVDLPTHRRRLIRDLNDQLRRGEPGPHDMVVITQGVQALGQDSIEQIVAVVQSFAVFTEDNDPNGEHDFAALEAAGHRLFFKIDYYNLERDGLSSDPTDQEMTSRVLTIMLASEY